ncbi:MAG: DUF4157 domain-containing protein [Deltaproteobacteria bacterium]|nr:DUF4157 domain-containing protein [Deltaproteobacteria bacterium]
MGKLGGDRGGTADRGAGAASDGAGKPGARTLTDGMVQRKAGGEAPSGSEVHEAAAHGLSGPAQELPFMAQIQQSFGSHDVSAIQAHVGGAAAEGAQAMGAQAFASGDAVAFGAEPDLHTAAHEAAHVVQQRGGVQLKGGVGAAGDAYERHADAVADTVVRGESAEALLSTMAPAGAASAGAGVQRQVVQRREDMEFEAREIMGDLHRQAENLISRYGENPDMLAITLLADISDWDHAQLLYHVVNQIGSGKGPLVAAMARQLPEVRINSLRANSTSQQVLMFLTRALRDANQVAEYERITGLLVSPEHAHLGGESAGQSPAVQGALAPHGARQQSVTQGVGPIVYDYYWIIMDTMPATTTPEAYLGEMGTDLNRAVANDRFDTINTFRRTSADQARGAPRVGDVYDIDIMGPDNGSVMLIEQAPNHFIFQTVTTLQTGGHPENGSREFGFQREDGGAVKWYTRGVSRPGSEAAGIVGRPIQEAGWTAMVTGIGNALAGRGGRLRPGSFGHWIRTG